MPIAVGDRLPDIAFKRLSDGGMSEATVAEIFSGRKVVVFAVPGAFTPTCSAKHLPGFVDQADAFKGRGVDEVVCVAVNDPFVMRAWGEHSKVGDTVTMLPDGNGEFTRAIGLEMDASGAGLGQRSQRYAMVVENQVVTALSVEQPGAFEVSSAEAILKQLAP